MLTLKWSCVRRSVFTVFFHEESDAAKIFRKKALFWGQTALERFRGVFPYITGDNLNSKTDFEFGFLAINYPYFDTKTTFQAFIVEKIEAK